MSSSRAGRKLDVVWDYFDKEPLKSPGHFSAKCKFCNKSWKRAYVNILQMHLANNCLECPAEVKSYYLGFLTALSDDEMDVDTLSTGSRGSIGSKRLIVGQQGIEDFYERKMLNNEIAVVNNKVTKELKNANNLTLDSHHTGNFLAAEIQTIIGSIGAEKFKAIVTDNGANVLTESENEIQNKTVKKYLKKRDFFEDIFALSQILLPVKNAIIIVESDNINLADVFIQLIRLAYKIKHINITRLNGFKQHAITSFNRRLEEFDLDLYLLAYFLHPGYRAEGIQTGHYKPILNMAGKIWKNLGNDKDSLEKLYLKMNHYKLKVSPYDVKYLSSEDTPKLWWLAIDDVKKNPLQQLALLIFDITPHSASCERTFSALGWIYGKRRLRLSTTKVEGMAKIRSYYMSEINELKYMSKQYNKEELKIMVEEAMVSYDENEEEDKNEEDDSTEINNNEIIVPNNEVYVLIENFINLEEVPFKLHPDDIDESDESSENEIEERPEEHFGIISAFWNFGF
ncbi:hypothetical protein RhiirA1_392219 [Rhizophagus irregularis]|uniref:Uncharacterized protein n=1 Tax=Rhizophagus irregularis TaxID=588596 RepID=A0A2I1EIS2_9GLOM|nr:hypothetical protein RhiirA1_392219 [Rhizophagus irregularis]PKY22018.1 hypothetical protein RhiirB3_386107 [Rhizophagus irregularis]